MDIIFIVGSALGTLGALIARAKKNGRQQEAADLTQKFELFQNELKKQFKKK